MRFRFSRIKNLTFLIFLLGFLVFLLKYNFEHGPSENNSDELLIVANLKKFELNVEEFKLLENLNEENHEIELRNDLEYLESLHQTAKSLKSTNESIYKSVVDHKKAELIRENIYILEYTNVFFQPKFCNKNSHDIFDSPVETCPYTNCIYTCDKEKHTNTADALIFHQRDLETELYNSNDFKTWLENTKQLPFKSTEEKMRSIQNPAQVWILWNDEATSISKEFNKISALFNWTMSYLSDSEIYEGAYGFFIRKQNQTGFDLKNQMQKAFFEFKRRKNAILWFLSNCNSPKRIEIALNISKYYPVHIYGHCDPLSKPNYQENKHLYKYLRVFNQPSEECSLGSKCENDKLTSYKYYFAFENKNCSDYITEKLWRSLNKTIIPIVFRPDLDSFKRFSIPSKALIHLQDFNFDTELLVDYLLKMDNSFPLYFSYLKWTYIYIRSLYHAQYTEPHRMCQMCKQLNELRSKRSISYTHIANFFNEKCII
jgi:glycoprotein 3-alpha-L-fucosyltransferase